MRYNQIYIAHPIGSRPKIMRPIFTFLLLIAAALIGGCATPTSANLIHGEALYTQGKGEAPACLNCHTLEAEAFGLGPTMIGISSRAAVEITPDQTVEDYLRESILNPNQFLVPGYRNIMYGEYAKHFSEQDITDIIGYILSL